ncbi:MAG: TATA-box-binding protein [Promethearchaeota archaeon]|nr:MAG: TATA-box-binding protein [Candidatus Lokiarchaeota archaeon]
MEIEKESKRKTRSLTYTIQNIVVKVDLNPHSTLNLSLELEKLSQQIKNAEYNKKRFPGLFLRIRDPKCVAIIFRNAKIILSGLKFFNDIEIVLFRILAELKSESIANINLNTIQSEVVNIVITANLSDWINLDLATLRLENSIYEPEVFPALIYKSNNPVKCVFLVFNNGKIVLTGINREESIEPALINFGKLLKKNELFMKS